jgi:hypothetical protein
MYACREGTTNDMATWTERQSRVPEDRRRVRELARQHTKLSMTYMIRLSVAQRMALSATAHQALVSFCAADLAVQGSG